MVVLRWDDEYLEVTMLGDCTAVVALRNGTTRVIHDSTLDELDQQNFERMYRYAKQNNTTMASVRKTLNDRFIENRLKMNTPDGYWVADVTCQGFGHETIERFLLSEVAGVFACSDGYAAAVAMGVAADAPELALRVLSGEGAHIAANLRKEETMDKECWRVHRSKTSDDATYIAIGYS